MTDAFQYTYIPILPETKAPALGAGWHYDEFAYGTDYRGEDRRQAGHVTSEKAKLLVIDVDEPKPYADGTLPPPFAETHLGKLLLQLAQPFSLITYVSAENPAAKQHWYLDMRGWEDPYFWPQQWATHQWGYDVKSNGFVRAEPAYLPLAGTPGTLPNSILEMLFTAVDHDRALHDQLSSEHNGTPQGQATGAFSSWSVSTPDSSVTSDNELTAAVMSMAKAGLADDEIFQETARIRCPLEDDWTEDQIQRKIDSAREKLGDGPLLIRQWEDGFVSEERAAAIIREADYAYAQHLYHVAMGIPVRGLEVPDYGGDPAWNFSNVPRTPGDVSETWSPSGFTDQQVALSCLDEVHRRGRHRFVRELSRLIERRGDRWEVLTDKDGAASYLLSHLAWSLPECSIPYDKARAKELREEEDSWREDNDLETVAQGRAELAEYKKFEQKMRFQNSSTCAGIISKIRSLMDAHPVTISAMDLDSDPDVLWAGGIPWDLAHWAPSVRVHSATPHLLTAGYTPDFTGRPTPLFDKWMAAVLPDESIRDWVLNLMGATLAGGGKFIPELISYKGNTGKTSTVELLADLLGNYSEVLPEDLLTGSQSHPEVYLRLKGKKLAYFDEQPGNGRASRHKLKTLAGGSRLSGRGVNGKEVVNFKPSHTLWLTVNEDIPLGDEAIQLRVRRVYFNGNPETVAEAVKGIWNTSRSMTDAWRAEAPAVLGMLMLRCQAYIRNPGLTVPPPQAEMELIEAVAEQDTVYEWFSSSVQATAQNRVSNDLLRSNYTDWCKRVGVPDHRRVQDTREFGRAVSKAASRCGVDAKQYKSGSTRGWEGLALSPLVQVL